MHHSSDLSQAMPEENLKQQLNDSREQTDIEQFTFNDLVKAIDSDDRDRLMTLLDTNIAFINEKHKVFLLGDCGFCINGKITALYYASLQGCKELAHQLLIRGANVNKGEDSKYDQCTPLIGVIKRIDDLNTEIFSEKVIEANNPGYHSDRKLKAQELIKKLFEVVVFLLENGAGIEIPNLNFFSDRHTHDNQKLDLPKEYATPLTIATFNRDADLIDLLLSHGAKTLPAKEALTAEIQRLKRIAYESPYTIDKERSKVIPTYEALLHKINQHEMRSCRSFFFTDPTANAGATVTGLSRT